MAEIKKFVFGKNYKFFAVEDGGETRYYVANGGDVAGSYVDAYHLVDAWSEELSSAVNRLFDVGELPFRYGSSGADCDVYLPDIDYRLSGLRSLNGSIYCMTEKTSCDFVHPADERRWLSLSSIHDTTNTYWLSSGSSVNSYLFGNVEDIVQDQDFLTKYGDFNEFVRLNAQMNLIYRFFCRKYKDIATYVSQNQRFEQDLSSVVFLDYFKYLDGMDEVYESEDIRFAKLAIGAFLKVIAADEFKSSMSWEEHAKALRSVFEEAIGGYVNSQTIPSLLSGMDEILRDAYEAVLSTEIDDTQEIDYTGSQVNDFGNNYDIVYSYSGALDEANKTNVADNGV